MKDRWTAEEYRRFRETGKMPEEKPKITAEEVQRIVEAYRHPTSQAEIENAWEKAEREGRTMALGIPDVPKKRRKYGNEITYVDGIRFDSKHEAEVYKDLMADVRDHTLKCVLRQVRFDLGGGPYAQAGSQYQYVADFVTIDAMNRVGVIDAKSEATRKNRTYINKKKAMLAQWDIRIVER